MSNQDWKKPTHPIETFFSKESCDYTYIELYELAWSEFTDRYDKAVDAFIIANAYNDGSKYFLGTTVCCDDGTNYAIRTTLELETNKLSCDISKIREE